MKYFSKVLSTVFAVLLGSSIWVTQFAFSATGSGHIKGYDSVDGDEIRYGGSTKYTTAWNHGIKQWNALGSITIKPDSALAIQDLTVGDVYSTESWTGQYTYYPGLADTIKFNKRFFDTREENYNKKTATHELGHALGIVDHEADTYSGIIMYYKASTVTSLKAHDKEDYADKWD